MGFVRGLTRPAETRANIESPSVPLSAAAVNEYLGVQTNSTPSGINVTPQTATNQSAVWRCISLVSAISGYLPLMAYKSGTFSTAQSNLLKNPHPEMTASELWSLTATHRALYGNAFLQKMKNRAGATVELWPIHPEKITGIERITSGPYRGMKLFKVNLDDGGFDVFTTDDILHVPHFTGDGMSGISPIRAARGAIGQAQAAEEYGAKLFGSGNLASGILQTEQKLKQEDAEKLQQRWEQKAQGARKSHSTVVLDQGAQFHQLTMPNSDSQFIESRQFQLLEVARFFGVPPFLMFETEKSTSWGTGLEQQSLGWLSFDIAPRWLDPLESRLTKEVTGNGIEAHYDMARLKQGDSTAMANFYRTMREIGCMNADEIRAEIHRDPLPNGQGKIYLMPSNMQSLSGSPTKLDPTVGGDVSGDGQPDAGPGVAQQNPGKKQPTAPGATPPTAPASGGK